MHQGFFVDYIYTEVFIMVSNITGYQLIEIHAELFDVMESLNPKDINCSKNIKVVHGCLLPAAILPNNFNGIGGFIVVNLPNTNYGLFTGNAFYNSDELATAIQTTINHKCDIEIEDVFVLYGSEIPLTLSIAEDELDEELIERGCAIVREVKQIKEKLEIGDVAWQKM